MAEYSTEQKKILSDFLYRNSDVAYSIEELTEMLRKEYGDHAPAKSTVYRLIPHLVEEGRVRRFIKGQGRRFVYQAVTCDSCHSHLHLKCVDCGRLIHLDCRVSDELIGRVRSVSDFSVSEEQTVLFGACADCKKSKGGIKKDEI